MTFFDPTPAAEHRCDPPNVDAFLPHDGWRCGCGKAFVRESVTQHGETWRSWRRDSRHDGPSSSDNHV